MATTVNTLTDAAYRKCGIINPSGTEDTYAFEALNNMISTWALEFILPYLVREDFDLVIGTSEYTIGSGGDFDTVRPISLSSVYLTNSDNYSFYVTPHGPKDHNKIKNKTLSGRPVNIYFVPEYPLAKLIFNKETDVVYTAHFEFWKALTEFAELTTTFALPLEFKEAIIYNLAVKLAEDNSIELPQTVGQTAITVLHLISKTLIANRAPPKVSFDLANRGAYNIIVDE